MYTLQQQWLLFSAQVVHPEATPHQRLEMRRAFYAGAESLFRMQHSFSNPDLSDDAGVALLEGINDEIKRFAKEVLEGRA